MTTESTNTTAAGQPLAVGSSDGLGPLPEPDLTLPSISPDGPDGAHFYRASTVRGLLQPQVIGYAYVMRGRKGKEFLALQTLRASKGKAKQAAKSMVAWAISERKAPLEMLRVCQVGSRVMDGQPPADNAFVAAGCERFRA